MQSSLFISYNYSYLLCGHVFAVVGRIQQLPRMCDIIQASIEGSEPFSEEKMEASGFGRGPTH